MICASRAGLVMHRNLNGFDQTFGLWPHQIHREQSVLQIGAQHLHTVGQQKGALKLARGNAAVQIMAVFILGLLATDETLVFLHQHFELVTPETGNSLCV